MVAFTGRSESQAMSFADQENSGLRNDLYKGRCFAKIKLDSVDSLESEIKQLYDIVNPGKAEEMGEENEEI
jgi:hypothetical protein